MVSKRYIQIIKTAVLASFPALVLCVFLDFFAGAFLGKFFTIIRENYPIILVILPGLMGLRGNIFGSMASRFSTMLYLGEMEPSLRDKTIAKNIFMSIVLSLLPVLLLWLVGSLKVRDVDIAIATLLIIVTSTIYTSLFLGYSTAFVSIFPFKKGIDPDAIAAPVITSLADLVTVPFLVVFIFLYSDHKKFITITTVALLIFLFLWRYSKFRKNDIIVFKEVISIILFLALISSITGSILESYSELLEKILIFSIMYPAVLGTTGSLGSIIGAKTSTKIHIGEIEKILNKDIAFEIGVYTLLAYPLALLSNGIATLVGRFLLNKSMGIIPEFVLLYPLLAHLVMWFAYFVAIFAEKMRLDPDNVTVPTITTLADMFSTLFVVFIIKLIT
ncbi:MAG: mgtE-like transporter [Pyrococcus sp.]|uniref:magnesium transporter n=1 Tax=Pyrococcus sp. TaxID=33866 RepID=UPI00258A4D6B|nr:magnesium transporter [Pyrococcus sp.]MDK2869320.1 mgtE-like transporter [Pyrococcus sp.]